MNYLFVVLVLCCTIAPSFAGHINTYSCNDGETQLATINYVDVKGCNRSQCNVIKGQNVTLSASFTPNVTVTNSAARAYVTQKRVTLPYRLPNKDACKNMKCPLKAGVPAVYTVTVKVYSYVFLGEAKVKGILEFDGGYGICFTFEAFVVK